MSQARVIGLGAEDRGDDAAGLLVARLIGAVAPAGVEVHECAGDAGALLELLDGARRAVLVDAAEGGRGAARAARRPSALVAAFDDLLFELEEPNLRGVAEAPDACRRRAAELTAEALRQQEATAPPETVAALMERVYEAQDAALLRRRRAGWGLDEPARGDDDDA